MKKMNVLLVVLFALCMILPASAQIKLGVLGGVNLANFKLDEQPAFMDLSSRTVFGIGGVIDYGLNNSIVIRLAPMYLQKGTHIEIEESVSQIYVIEFKLAYLELPAMLRYSVDVKYVKPYVIAGPTVGLNLTAKGQSYHKIDNRPSSSWETDIKDQIKPIDFGLSAGAGFSVPIGNNSFFLEARYAWGLSNIDDDQEHSDNEIKTRGIQVFAGLTFSFGNK